MSGIAMTMMVTTVSVITLVTGYFFWKVLTTPPREEPDSFEDNDEQPR